ncbi:MAG: amidohydrolase family protein [Pirellulaceae bacterium]
MNRIATGKLRVGLAVVWLCLACPALAQRRQSPQLRPRERATRPQPSNERPPSPEDSSLSLLPLTAYIGADVHTLDAAGTIRGATLLIQGDKIKAIGDGTLPIPDRAQRVDLTGTIVTPGLIDARSELWLTDPSADTGGNDSSLDIVEGVDPYDEAWHEVIRHGVTTVYVQPSSRGSLGGYGAVLSVAPVRGKPHIVAEHVALQASLGVGASSNRTRQQQLDRIKKVLEAAVDYQQKLKAYQDYLDKQKKAEADKSKTGKSTNGRAPPKSESPKDESGKTTQPSTSPAGSNSATKSETPVDQKSPADKSPADKSAEKKEEPPKKPDPDPIKDRLIDVLDGITPLRLEIHSADDVTFAKQLLSDEKFSKIQVIYDGLSDLRSASDSIVSSGAPLVLGPWLGSSAYSQEQWSEIFADYEGTLVVASFGSTGQSSRLLRAHAGRAIANGLERERVLKAITIDAARVLGVADQIGSIAVGKRADMVCFAGDPTDQSTTVNLVISGGEVVYESANQLKIPDDARLASDPASAKDHAGPDLLPPTLPTRFTVQSSRCLIEGKLQPGALVIDNGKISEVKLGTLDEQDDANVFSLENLVITPGLMSSHATLGLTGLIDPSNLPDSSMITAADAFVRDLRTQQSIIDQGLLRVALAPGSTNPVAGTISLIRLGAKDPVARREVATKLVLASRARSADRFPSSLAGQLQLLQQALSGVLLDTQVYLPTAVEQNFAQRRAATLKSTASGEIFSLIEAESDAELRAALDLVERFKLKAAVLGAQQLRPFIPRMQALGVGVVVQPISATTYQWYSDDLAAASAAGLPVFLAGETADSLRLTAALSGLPHDRALIALCDPTSQIGKDAAAFAVDAPADLVIWSDTPVNLAARPLQILVDGNHASEKGN